MLLITCSRWCKVLCTSHGCTSDLCIPSLSWLAELCQHDKASKDTNPGKAMWFGAATLATIPLKYFWFIYSRVCLMQRSFPISRSLLEDSPLLLKPTEQGQHQHTLGWGSCQGLRFLAWTTAADLGVLPPSSCLQALCHLCCQPHTLPSRVKERDLVILCNCNWSPGRSHRHGSWGVGIWVLLWKWATLPSPPNEPAHCQKLTWCVCVNRKWCRHVSDIRGRYSGFRAKPYGKIGYLTQSFAPKPECLPPSGSDMLYQPWLYKWPLHPFLIMACRVMSLLRSLPYLGSTLQISMILLQGPDQS